MYERILLMDDTGHDSTTVGVKIITIRSFVKLMTSSAQSQANWSPCSNRMSLFEQLAESHISSNVHLKSTRSIRAVSQFQGAHSNGMRITELGGNG